MTDDSSAPESAILGASAQAEVNQQMTEKDQLEWIRQVMSSPDPLALVNADGTGQRLNPAMRRELGADALPQRLIRSVCSDSPPVSVNLGLFSASESRQHVLRVDLGNQLLLVLRDHAADPEIDRLHRRLEAAEKSSVTDRLTGLWNRQQFESLLATEHARAIRYRHPVSLLIVDLDHFKRFNDRHGHAEGDRILNETARRLTNELRAIDSLFRWGGEEFVLLAPNAGQAGASIIAERLRRAVGNHDFGVEDPVTISIGVAALEQDEPASAWFERADRALYAAKEAGRDRVVAAPETAPWPGQEQDNNPLIPWLPRYESGHPLIDRQHKRLFELANALISASIDPEIPNEELSARLEALAEHALQHFRDEEAILEDIGFSNLEQHRRGHRALAEKLRSLRARVSSGIGSHSELLDFLVNALIRQHLMTADVEFFPHLAPEA